MINLKIKSIIFISVLLCTLYCAISTAKAQEISLSVSPPLLELIIQPGKKVEQVYTLSNNGGDINLIPSIVYFEPSDSAGNINLTEVLAPDWVRYNSEVIKIKSGEKINFNVIFSPPEDTLENDHFLTLTFKSELPVDVTKQSSSFYQSVIGTNMLITVSKDGFPKKYAEIIEFSSPKIVDSFFGDISFQITLKNTGNSYWKPIGKIISGEEILKLAPQNILSGYSRNIECVENEELVKCKLKKIPWIGKITSKLEFTLDEEADIQKKESTTIVFPFTSIGLIIFLLTAFKSRRIFKLWA